MSIFNQPIIPVRDETNLYVAYWTDKWRIKLHREDGPAVIYKNASIGDQNYYNYGVEEWWFEGLRHRLDGPALYNTQDKDYVPKFYCRGVLHNTLEELQHYASRLGIEIPNAGREIELDFGQ